MTSTLWKRNIASRRGGELRGAVTKAGPVILQPGLASVLLKQVMVSLSFLPDYYRISIRLIGLLFLCVYSLTLGTFPCIRLTEKKKKQRVNWMQKSHTIVHAQKYLWMSEETEVYEPMDSYKSVNRTHTIIRACIIEVFEYRRIDDDKNSRVRTWGILPIYGWVEKSTYAIDPCMGGVRV